VPRALRLPGTPPAQSPAVLVGELLPGRPAVVFTEGKDQVRVLRAVGPRPATPAWTGLSDSVRDPRARSEDQGRLCSATPPAEEDASEPFRCCAGTQDQCCGP